MSNDRDTGDIAQVEPGEWEDRDWPEMDSHGGDDSSVEEMIQAMLEDSGVIVPLEELQ